MSALDQNEIVRILWLRAVSVVALHAGCGRGRVLKPAGWRARRLRQRALYLAVVGAGLPVKRLAAVTGVCRRAIQLVLRETEERRDGDAELDALLAELERRLVRGVDSGVEDRGARRAVGAPRVRPAAEARAQT